MSALELEVYEIFKARFTDKEASKVLALIDAKAEEKYDQKKDVLSAKQDISDVRLELREVKSDIIKWMFVFWVGSTLATLGGLVAIVRFMIVR